MFDKRKKKKKRNVFKMCKWYSDIKTLRTAGVAHIVMCVYASRNNLCFPFVRSPWTCFRYIMSVLFTRLHGLQRAMGTHVCIQK